MLGHVSLANIQIRLRIATVWSASSLRAFWIVKDAKLLHEDNEDGSDCADTLADMNARWAHMLDGTFSYVAVQTKCNKYRKKK